MRLDRRRKSTHVVLLVDHVVREEQPAGCDAREDHDRRTSCSQASTRRERRDRRCRPASGSPGTRRREHAHDVGEARARWMLAAASLARTGSNSMVTSRPPVSRRPRPIQIAAVAAGRADFEDAPGLGRRDEGAQEPAILLRHRELSLVRSPNRTQQLLDRRDGYCPILVGAIAR